MIVSKNHPTIIWHIGPVYDIRPWHTQTGTKKGASAFLRCSGVQA